MLGNTIMLFKGSENKSLMGAYMAFHVEEKKTSMFLSVILDH